MRLIDDRFNFDEYAVQPEKSRVVPASGLADEVIDLLYGQGSLAGASMPWSKSLNLIRFLPGEVSVYVGMSGNGKSLVTSQIALGLINQGEKALIASYEMKLRTTMKRLTTQAAGVAEPDIRWIRAFHRWTDGKLWLHDHYGYCKPEQVLAVLRYCADDLKITHLFIDSMMKVVEKEDDLNEQKKFIGDLCAIAQSWNVHIHLIHHSKKMERETDIIDKFSAKGSGSITDQADNVFLIQRNKKKEKDLARGEVNTDPDMFLTTNKQRNTEYEGTIGLWYCKGAQSFSENDKGIAPYIHIDVPEREPGEEG